MAHHSRSWATDGGNDYGGATQQQAVRGGGVVSQQSGFSDRDAFIWPLAEVLRGLGQANQRGGYLSEPRRPAQPCSSFSRLFVYSMRDGDPCGKWRVHEIH